MAHSERLERRQAQLSALRSEVKRLEYEKLAEQKELEKALALARVGAENLEKRLRDREAALASLQGSTRAELQEARGRLKAVKEEADARALREQEEWLKKHEAQRARFEAMVRDLKEEIAASQTVSQAARGLMITDSDSLLASKPQWYETVTPSESFDQEMKVAEEKARCLAVSEQQAHALHCELKSQLELQAAHHAVRMGPCSSAAHPAEDSSAVSLNAR